MEIYCPICNHSLTQYNEALVQQHINECIDRTEVESPNKSACPICEAFFSKLEELEKHVTECLTEQDYAQPILTSVQRRAIDLCQRRAKIFGLAVVDNLAAKLISLNYSEDDLDLLRKYFENHVRLVIHVRLETVLDFFLKDEFYRNLFETRTSGGSSDLNARRVWENNLFSNIYAGAPAHERVKYGALNLTCNPRGAPACAYGESFLTIKREVHDRISFCLGDSSKQEAHMATFRHPNIILNLMPLPLLKEMVQIAKEGKYKGPSYYIEYVEGQIHGPLSLKRDIDSLHVPSHYKDNSIMMAKLEKFVELYNVPIIFFDGRGLL